MYWQDAVEQALGSLQGELRDLAADLIAVPSVGGTPAEQQAQHLIGDWLQSHGLAVSRTDVTVAESEPDFPGMEVPRSRLVNVVGRLPGSGPGPDLMLLGHTDVVPADDPAQFHPAWRDGRLYGRGASDMKTGVAAMCIAAAALARSGVHLRGSIIVAPVSAEEDGGAGTFGLLQQAAALHLAPDSAVIIPEPTSCRIVSGNAGSLTFKLTLKGRAAHGAMRWRGVNPLDSLPVVLEALRRLEIARCERAGEAFADWPLAYPISLGTINGGDWASTVPPRITVTGRYGVRIGETLQQARQAFEGALAEACGQDPWLREHPVEVTWWGARFASAATDSGSPVITALRRAGAAGVPCAAPYGSDLRLLVAHGLPTVQFGPGDPYEAHSADESVCWDDVVLSARTLAMSAGHFCGTA